MKSPGVAFFSIVDVPHIDLGDIKQRMYSKLTVVIAFTRHVLFCFCSPPSCFVFLLNFCLFVCCFLFCIGIIKVSHWPNYEIQFNLF